MAYRFHLPLADVGNGIRPADGAQLFFYAVGTTNLVTVYTDFLLQIPSTNPVAAGPDGVFPAIFLSGSVDVVLHDKTGSLIYGPETVYPPSATLSSDDLNNLISSKTLTPAEIAFNISLSDVDLGFDPGHLKRYKAAMDGVSNDFSAWEMANGQCALGGAPIYVPRTEFGFATASTLPVDYRSDIYFEPGAKAIYTGTDEVPIMDAGDATNIIANRRYENLWLERANQSDWTNEANIGLRMEAAVATFVSITKIQNNTLGFQAIPSGGRGFQANTLMFSQMINNKVARDWSNATNGFCNDNSIIGGRLTVFTGVNSTLARYGDRITSSDATYLTNNGNRFSFATTELNNADASAEAVAILIEHGEDNRFIEPRSETNDVDARCENDSTRNVIELGFSSATATFDEIDNASENIIVTGRFRPRSYYTQKVAGGSDLGRKARGVSGTSIVIEGMTWGTSGGAARTSASSTSVTYDGDYITIPSSRGMGMYVDTSSIKSFYVKRSGTAGGRIGVTPYDIGDAILTGAGHIIDAQGITLTENANFGGHWVTGSDNLNDVYFRVGSSVEYVWVFVAGGTGSAVISSFDVYAQQTDNAVRAYTNMDTSLDQVPTGAYTRNATVIEDRTLLASASATATNNNNVLAALIGDLQARKIIP